VPGRCAGEERLPVGRHMQPCQPGTGEQSRMLHQCSAGAACGTRAAWSLGGWGGSPSRASAAAAPSPAPRRQVEEKVAKEGWSVATSDARTVITFPEKRAPRRLPHHAWPLQPPCGARWLRSCNTCRRMSCAPRRTLLLAARHALPSSAAQSCRGALRACPSAGNALLCLVALMAAVLRARSEQNVIHAQGAGQGGFRCAPPQCTTPCACMACRALAPAACGASSPPAAPIGRARRVTGGPLRRFEPTQLAQILQVVQ